MRNLAWKKKHVKQKVGEFDCQTEESLKLSQVAEIYSRFNYG
jgi:hypothetical protein